MNKVDVLFIDLYHSINDNWVDGIKNRAILLYYLIDFTTLKQETKNWFYDHCKYILEDLDQRCINPYCDANAFNGEDRSLKAKISYLDLINPAKAGDHFIKYYLVDSYIYFLDNTINCSYFRNPSDHFIPPNQQTAKYDLEVVVDTESYFQFKGFLPALFNPNKNAINWLNPLLFKNYYSLRDIFLQEKGFDLEKDKNTSSIALFNAIHQNRKHIPNFRKDDIIDLSYRDEEIDLTLSNLFNFLEIQDFNELYFKSFKSDNLAKEYFNSKENLYSYIKAYDNSIYY